jgi:phosphoglycolate phosphatase-like HAD superfamily hydrolase
VKGLRRAESDGQAYEMPASARAPLQDCAVMFDLDGTLIDSWRVAREAFCFAFRRATGREDAPVEGFTARLGMPFEQILIELGLPPGMRDHFHDYSQAHADTIRPYDGIPDELAILRGAGARLGIVTGKDRARAQYLLDNTRLATYFDALITPSDAPGKPDPGCLAECLQRVGCSKSLAVYVGDALTDMQCGQRAEVVRMYARWGSLKELAPGDYDLCADQPHEVSDILLTWALRRSVRSPAPAS